MSDNDDRKIVDCHITKSTSIFDPPVVMVKYAEDEEFERLFDYFPDEISFTADEFIGKTAAEGRHLKFKKDKAFLQS